MFGDHNFCDKEWCWAKGIGEKLHDAITKTVNKNFNSANQTDNTHHSDAIESSDALDDSAANSYGRLENDWLEALNIDDLPNEYNDEDGSEDSGEFIPNEDESDDDDDSAMDPVDESFEELSMKELNYQLAITDVMDQYSIEKLSFRKSN